MQLEDRSPPPAPPSLRPYQNQLIKDLYIKLGEGHRRIAIIAGTGAGKTVIGGKICADTVARGCRLLFIVHLDVLVGQTYEKMQAFGLRCGFIKAGWKEDPTAPIQIASIQTMAQRDWWRTWKAHVVFFDEGHTTVFSQIGQEIIYETHPKAVHLAMTATPYRLGKEQLGDHMQTLVASPVPAELQKMGFLSSMRYYGMPKDTQIDLAGVRTVAGDFDERDLKNACDRPELVDRIVEEWQRLTPGKRTIAFCVDIEHARHVAEAFRAIGVSADLVDGGTPIKERHRLYGELGSGKLLVLTSCNVISIGFDEPSVEVGLLLRPTQSRALHIQQIGRVMRISPQTGKTQGIILDQAGNLQRLGFPEDTQSYRLPTQRDPGDSQAKPAKQCPQCNRLVWGFITQCPGCGFAWETEPQIRTEALVEVHSEHKLRQMHKQEMLEFLQVHRRRSFQEGASPNWTKNRFRQEFGCSPDVTWYRGLIFGDNPSLNDKIEYRNYLAKIGARQGKDLTWVIEEYQQEFGEEGWQEVFYGK
ncbi:MAG: DEAD/DEAH box helicase family protein [Oculatellaceae cyanobacterium Prado106]|jgi:superfamily II DNA or RNA helicase|nr:DEAD/DEAH box helicase family protein [Oculatellaceae cyanobacterium Prado106]